MFLLARDRLKTSFTRGLCSSLFGFEKENKLQFSNSLGFVLIGKYLNDRLAKESR